MKDDVLRTKTWNEIWKLEEISKEKYNKDRNAFFNEIISDKDMSSHVSKLFGIEEKHLENLFVINGKTPLDDFDEE